MALTGEQIEDVTRGAVDLYRSAEQAILAEVTRRLAAGQDAPDWAVTRLAALGSLRESTERILALVAGRAPNLVGEMLAAAYRTGQGIATRDLPATLLRDAPDLARAVQTVPRLSVVESLAGALVADISAKHSAVLRRVLDVYRQTIAQASAVSVAGGMTRRQASQWAYQRFVDQGVTSFVDQGGRRWRLSSYVEMGARTVTQRAAVQGQTDRLTTLGVDTVIVSDSPRECERCRPWEGKVLSISGAQRGRVEMPRMVGSGTVTVDIAGSVAEARAAGLQHPNCTHSLRSYLPGATRRPARPTANPRGYEAKERQRAIERQIRRWKERETSALTPEAAAGAKVKTRQWQGAMRDHLAANPELKRLPYREQIGAGNIPPKSPVAAAPATPRPRPASPAPTVDPAEAARKAWDDRAGRARTGQGALDAAPLRLDPRTGRLTGGDAWPGQQAAGDAVRSYQGSGFQIVNKALRQRVSPLPERAAELRAGLDDALSRSRLITDIVVERGFRPTDAFGNDWATADVTGWEWTELAYSSVTADPTVAAEFAGSRVGIIMRILVPRGTGAVRVSDLGGEDGGSEAEAEILLARGTRYRVVRDHGVIDGKRRVDVEVLRG
ncbi:phage minor capsid protein [Micromonospora sp. HUAS LYJ1]|uniref:phage minor capsid protein n=1 Tax=Micromonospora sp. HUAS LYJ1 TaxID=3061626 RepID=UPI002672A737|nr:phage minor capsid protein [Micromonospora sp. HUAS LYJ1]WKU03746.1 ADP-ribosyltransferase [Micromonospora sp. HUAS LYJ1]